MANTGKQYIFLTAFILLILVIVFIFLINSGIFSKEPAESYQSLTKPAYLRQPIPKIDKIKTIVDNPKFKELKYVKSFFEPVEPTVSGRANPFMPFAETEEKK